MTGKEAASTPIAHALTPTGSVPVYSMGSLQSQNKYEHDEFYRPYIPAEWLARYRSGEFEPVRLSLIEAVIEGLDRIGDWLLSPFGPSGCIGRWI